MGTIRQPATAVSFEHRSGRCLWLASLLVAGAAYSNASQASGESIALQGTGSAAACQTCHGAGGQGNAQAGFPRLAGLPAPYLLRQLQEFAGGQRQNAVMMPIAKALSEADRKAVADYYAALSPPASGTPGAAAASALATSALATSTAVASGTAASTAAGPGSPGAELALRGRWSQGVPACVQCHGPGGRGVGDDFPPLAGQPASYIVGQFQAWKAGTRPAGPLGLMGMIAKKLSDADAGHVAQHFATLPVATPAAPAAGVMR